MAIGAGASYPEWIADDRLLWHQRDGRERSLWIAGPTEAPRRLRSWPSGVRVRSEPSSDGSLLLVEVFDIGQDETAPEHLQCSHLERWVYDVRADEWRALEVWPSRPYRYQQDACATRWAGPRTLARCGPGFLALEDLDAPGRTREVFGSLPR